MAKFLLTILTFLLLVQYTFTQSQATTGNIEGRVIDPNGDAVPQVKISAVNINTGFSRATVSDENGIFVFVLMPPGTYKLSTEVARGFAAAESDIFDVTVGSKAAIEIRLGIANFKDVVSVHGAEQGIEATRTSISSTIGEKGVRSLPSLMRNFMDFIPLTPGIVRDPARGADLAIGGQKGTLNSIQVDGVNGDNTFFAQPVGRVGTERAQFQFSLDAVKEFQVNQNGYSAEFGRAAGGVINVVTKSGTNQFKGGGFWFLRNDALNANSPGAKAQQAESNQPNERGPLRINEFGGTLGGPIRKDRIFFFAAYDGQRRILTNRPRLKSLPFAPPAVKALIEPKLHSYRLVGDQDSFFFKTDLKINGKNLVWARINLQHFNGLNFVNSGILTPEENNGVSIVKTASFISDWIATLNNNWFNEFRVQIADEKEPTVPHTSGALFSVNAFTPGGINDGVFSWGSTASILPRQLTVKRLQFVDNQTYITGNHAIKFGADLLFNRILNFSPLLFGGAYTFPNYDALNDQLLDPAGQYASRFRQSFAGPNTSGAATHPDSSEYGFFVQNDWRATPRLTLNVGLRYDYQKIAKPLIRNPSPALLAAGYDTSFAPSDTNNFAPRFGASYAFDKKTVLRGGYGIFFGRTPGISVSAAQSQNGTQIVAIDIRCDRSPPVPCPIYPTAFSDLPVGASPAPINITLFDRNYRQPFTHQAHVQFEREILNSLSFSATYTVVRGQDLTRARDVNLGTPTNVVIPVYNGTTSSGETLTFQQFNVRPIPGFEGMNVIESTAKSFYQGLSLELNRRFTRHLQFNASYVLSQANDDQPDQTLFAVILHQTDLAATYGRSDVDIRQRFLFIPVFETGKIRSKSRILSLLLSNINISGVFTAQTGAAYSAVVSGDLDNDRIDSNTLVPGTRRNEFSTPPRYILDLRVGRTMRFGERFGLTLFAEGFNALNRANVLNVNNVKYAYNKLPDRLAKATNFGTPRSFLAPSQAVNAINSGGRAIQIGLRLDF